MRKTIGFMLVVSFANAAVGGDLTYELSFGDHIELFRDGQEVSITARNETDEEIICGALLLTDPGVRDLPRGTTSAHPRIWFEPKNEDQSCSTWCSPIAQPPPYVVLGQIYGPFPPGEEKHCDYRIRIAEEFSGTIRLVGANTSITVTRVQPEIPALAPFGASIMFLLLLLFGANHRASHR